MTNITGIKKHIREIKQAVRDLGDSRDSSHDRSVLKGNIQVLNSKVKELKRRKPKGKRPFRRKK